MRLPQVRIARAGGIRPLVTMLSSASPDSQTHAAGALYHLSASAAQKLTQCMHPPMCMCPMH